MSEHTPLPADCPPWKRALAYLRRQSPWVLAVLLLLAFLPAQHLFTDLMSWAHGAAPIVHGGPDLDGAQVEAANEARWVPLGIIVSKLGAAIFYFFVGVGIVWWTMHRILPGLPPWAKKYFTARFEELPLPCQYAFYLLPWVALLWYFSSCLQSASLVQ